jgi:serine/threonine-protein kinase
VDAAIRRALEKLPADRFPLASDFAEALTDPSFTHGKVVGAGAVGSGGAWRPAALVLGGLAALFASTTAWALLSEDPPRQVERFGSPFLAGQEPSGTGPANFTMIPDGSGAVYVSASTEDPASRQLWIRRWTDLEASPIRGTDGANQPDVSFDGTEVAFHRSGEISIAPIASGPVRELGRGQWPQWGQDGRIYGTLGAVGTVAYPVTGGPADTVARLQGEDQQYVLSDVLSEEIALGHVIRGDGTFQVRMFDLETGETRYFTDGYLPQYVDPGYMVFGFDGSLMGVPFDTDAAEPVGVPVALYSDLNIPRVSRTGRLLFTTGGQAAVEREMVWVTREGEMTPIDPNWTFLRGDVNVTWSLSPDDRQLVLREQNEGAYDIWVKQLDDGPRSRLTFDERGDYFPMWAPDGESVTYVSGPATGLEVYSRRADGTGEPTQLVDLDQSVALAFWSPDMEWLILRTTTGAGNVFGRDIVAMRPGVDSEPVPLMTDDYDETDPALSPDGRWIAYVSNETGRYEVYVRPFPDVDSGRWQVSTQGGFQPKWSDDGREIFFRDAAPNMVAARVDGSGAAFRVAGSEILFPIPVGIDQRESAEGMPFDVTSDGQRFVMARAVSQLAEDGSALPTYILVQNFVEELKARVGR